MKERGKLTENERRDWVVILVILLIGFLCVILAGSWAIRFAPLWRLDTNMRSNLDPDSDFLTSRPSGFFAPLDPSILTQPVWINVFLTPGASFPTRTPVPLTNTPLPTNTLPVPSNTPTRIPPSPTSTLPYFPPPTRTSIPNTPLPSTATSNPPATAIPADLSITKTDGASTYTAGSSITYTVTITNNGPNNVTGAAITDSKPVQVTTWGWCVAPCTPVVNTSGNLGATVNLNSGSSVTYMILANIDPAATGNLVNTATVSVPAGYTDTVPGNNSATDTNILAASADLQITKTDNATHYVADATKTYIITVTNAGPANVTGATVTDALAANPNIASAAWTCLGTNGGTCTSNGSGNISDSVDLPAGATVTYIVNVTVVGSPSGELVNTSTVTGPLGITDPVPGNNSATDTDTLIVTDAPPDEVEIGPGNGVTYTFTPPDSAITLAIPPITRDDNPDYDLVYYELAMASGILMDHVIIQISDGSNWYTVLNWGDGFPDTNTSISIPLDLFPNPSPCNGEPDNCEISAAYLRNGTGVQIDISIVPSGVYSYIRIQSLSTGDGDGADLDAVEILP
jgi:uncharacterized repeat protein (TIGR01451 family)